MVRYDNQDIMNLICHGDLIGNDLHYFEGDTEVTKEINDYSIDMATSQVTVKFTDGNIATILMRRKVDITIKSGAIPMDRKGKIKKQK